VYHIADRFWSDSYVQNFIVIHSAQLIYNNENRLLLGWSVWWQEGLCCGNEFPKII